MPENLKIETARGSKVFYREEHPNQEKGIIIISHGYAEHSGYYLELMQALADHGYGSYALDHCGHGLSEEERGHLDRFQVFVEDLDQFVDFVRERHPQLPLFIYGHSMGGLIAFLYGIQFPEKICGQIFTGPALGRPVGTALIPGFLFEILNQYFNRRKIYQVLSHRATRNLEVRKKSNEDPLVLKYATVGFFYEFVYRGVNEAKQKAEQYRLPCLFLHGKADRIIPYQATPFIFSKISSQDKELKLYEGLYHELIQEPERDRVLGDILEWLEKRVK